MRVLLTVYKILGGMAHLLKGKTQYQILKKANLNIVATLPHFFSALILCSTLYSEYTQGDFTLTLLDVMQICNLVVLPRSNAK